MRRPEEVKRLVVTEWLRKGQKDLELAEHLLAEGSVFPSAIAFHSQQAAEKYLKGLLAWQGIAFPKTHDLAVLLDLVETADSVLAESLQDVIVLTPYAVEMRYPGDRHDVAAEEAGEAVGLARKVQSSVKERLGDIL